MKAALAMLHSADQAMLRGLHTGDQNKMQMEFRCLLESAQFFMSRHLGTASRAPAEDGLMRFM